MNPEKKSEGQKDKEEQVKGPNLDKELLHSLFGTVDSGHESSGRTPGSGGESKVPLPEETNLKVKCKPFKPLPKPTSDPVVSKFQNMSIKKGVGRGVAQSLDQLGDKEAAGSSFGHMPSLRSGLMDKRTRMEQMQPPPTPAPQALRPSAAQGAIIPGELVGQATNPFHPDQGIKFGTVTVQGRGRGLGRTSNSESMSYQAIQLTAGRMRELAQAQNKSSMSRSRDTKNSGLRLSGCAEEYGLVFSGPPNKKGRLGGDDAESERTQPKPKLPDKCDRERYQAALLEQLLEGFKEVNKP